MTALIDLHDLAMKIRAMAAQADPATPATPEVMLARALALGVLQMEGDLANLVRQHTVMCDAYLGRDDAEAKKAAARGGAVMLCLEQINPGATLAEVLGVPPAAIPTPKQPNAPAPETVQ